MSLATFEKTIGYRFKNERLLKEALTHRSYLNEVPDWGVPHNERLEFLGDAVIELVVTEALYHRFPDYPEGELTPIRAALVNYQMLASVGRDIQLESAVLLSRGEAKDVGRARETILANAIEAVIGAVYLDGGYEPAAKLIERFVLTHLEEVLVKGLHRDAKSLLQERTQERNKVTPSYRVLSQAGPDHAKTFTVGVYLGETLLAQGTGMSKQEAEVEAAKKALEITGA